MLTQSVVVQKFLDDIEHFKVPVLLGLCPLVSSRNAEFLHNEVPGTSGTRRPSFTVIIGMSVPQPIRERMAAVGSGPPAVAEGIAIAKEMLNRFKDRVVGVYIMPQLGKFSSAVRVLEDVGYKPPSNGTS